MDISTMGTVLAIVGITYLIGQLCKTISAIKDELIPVIVGAAGGVLGIVLGYIVSMAANRILPMISSDIDVTVSPSFNSIVVAFGISVGIGVLFGYLPAKRAARLNPIEALRYD